MSYATIDALRESLADEAAPMVRRPEYIAKMMHAIPDGPVVERIPFILERCQGKAVLDIGASGALHEELVKVAASVTGLDKEAAPGIVACDLNDMDAVWPALPKVDVVVCGEVLEHVSSPGALLSTLRVLQPQAELVVSVPNAFSDIARAHLLRGKENVNIEHVAWYSTRTLATLLTRHGWVPQSWAWYNGKPRTAEGILVVAKGV